MTEALTIKSWSDIPGFFRWVDRWVFDALLKSQEDSPLGNLVELGTYQAKSAVIIGSFVRPGERFVAVDLFGREDLLDSSTQRVDEPQREPSAVQEPHSTAVRAQLPCAARPFCPRCTRD